MLVVEKYCSLHNPGQVAWTSSDKFAMSNSPVKGKGPRPNLHAPSLQIVLTNQRKDAASLIAQCCAYSKALARRRCNFALGPTCCCSLWIVGALTSPAAPPHHLLIGMLPCSSSLTASNLAALDSTVATLPWMGQHGPLPPWQLNTRSMLTIRYRCSCFFPCHACLPPWSPPTHTVSCPPTASKPFLLHKFFGLAPPALYPFIIPLTIACLYSLSLLS